jgi:hypothetical protein
MSKWVSKWVQHKSGQGDKWKRIDSEKNQDPKWDGWIVESKEGLGQLILPRSEYQECPAPERWIDVTGHCNSFTKGEGKATCLAHSGLDVLSRPDLYRLRKVQGNWSAEGKASEGKAAPSGWAFVIEQREEQP